MAALAAFCNQMIAFAEDISDTYPEERDIASAAQALKLLKKANPRMMHTLFMKHVYEEFAQSILEEDEESILRRTRTILQTGYADMNVAFWIFDKHWSTMLETNKQHVWRYVKSLVLLAARVT